VETHSSDEDGQSDVNSAVEELLEDFEPQVLQNAIFSPTQMSALQETVSFSVNEALWFFNNHEAQARFSDDLRTPSPRTLNTVTPLGLHRPLEKSLEDKILRGEYIDHAQFNCPGSKPSGSSNRPANPSDRSKK